MYEELSEECQRGDNAIKKQIHKEAQKFFLINFRDFCTSLWLERGVGLKFFEALDSNTTTAQLDDAATFEIVEDRGGRLARGANQTGDVVMCKWDEVIAVRNFTFASVG